MTDWPESACGPLSPWSENLNAAQRAAVEHTTGPLLVIAGAGSGKTRTLTHRVARLVDGGTPPPAILLIDAGTRGASELLAALVRGEDPGDLADVVPMVDPNRFRRG